MRLAPLAIAAAILACSAAAEATTIIIYIEPMTLERHMRVIDTPGPDRLLMCMTPPAISGCTEIPIKSAQRR